MRAGLEGVAKEAAQLVGWPKEQVPARQARTFERLPQNTNDVVQQLRSGEAGYTTLKAHKAPWNIETGAGYAATEQPKYREHGPAMMAASGKDKHLQSLAQEEHRPVGLAHAIIDHNLEHANKTWPTVQRKAFGWLPGPVARFLGGKPSQQHADLLHGMAGDLVDVYKMRNAPMPESAQHSLQALQQHIGPIKGFEPTAVPHEAARRSTSALVPMNNSFTRAATA